MNDRPSATSTPDLARLVPVVARRMAAHVQHGRRHLLTEDVLRWATIDALVDGGVAPARLAVEEVIPGRRGKLDLVVLSHPPTAIEFKFPRDSRTGISPDTMTLGELLKDVYRLASLDGFGERWAVMFLNDRLCRFLSRRTDCRWSFVVGERLMFNPAAFAVLPKTASSQLVEWQEATATAECVVVETVTGHRLLGYRVETTL